MSLKNAKAYKSGIYISTPDKKTLIVPFKLSLAPTFDFGKKFQSTINRQIFFQLFSSTSRYTIIFSRDLHNRPEIAFNLYFTSPTQRGLYLKVQQALQTIKRTFNEFGILIKIKDTKQFLQQLQSTPKSIIEQKSLLYKLEFNKSVFMSVARLVFKDDEVMANLPLLISDFYAILSNGLLNIDVINSPLKKDSKSKAKAALTFVLNLSEFESLQITQKKLNSLLKIFCENFTTEESVSYQFFKQNEFSANFGKIILGQGMEYMDCDYTNLLNYASFFNFLLIKVK